MSGKIKTTEDLIGLIEVIERWIQSGLPGERSAQVSGGFPAIEGSAVASLVLEKDDQVIEIDLGMILGARDYDLAAALDGFSVAAGYPKIEATSRRTLSPRPECTG